MERKSEEQTLIVLEIAISFHVEKTLTGQLYTEEDNSYDPNAQQISSQAVNARK